MSEGPAEGLRVDIDLEPGIITFYLDTVKIQMRGKSRRRRGEELAKLNDILIQRLEKKGVAPNLIPGLIRNIATAIEDGSDVSFNEVNDRLQMLGWEDFELDDHTLQLIIANLETDGSRGRDESAGYWGLG